ncbi:MAG TPA: chemotaxis protein CheA [Bryobacteraceae bacterium]|nr:chemotaxis protein CheA [Bryobacteraceae bacterium]
MEAEANDFSAAELDDIGNDPELLGDFVVEAREHLGNIEMRLLSLDQDPGNAEALNAIFRGFHTIKGLAGFLNLSAVAEVAHEIETLLDLAREGELVISSEHVDVILAGSDYLARRIDELNAFLRTGLPPGTSPGTTPGHDQLLKVIRAMSDPQRVAAPHRARQASSAGADPVAAQLIRLGNSLEGESGPEAESGEAGAAQSIKVDTMKLDQLVDLVGELVIAESLVRFDPELAREGQSRLTRKVAQLGRITGDVQRTAMSMRMVPIGQLFRKMNRLVRDVARQTGKQVELECSGEETELDRNIVENLSDALMHMVRNSVDHGIEPPEARQAAGKPVEGRVILRASHQAGHITIEITDDGQGLDRAAILNKARERGLVAENAEPGDSELFSLIFHPGFSTAQQVTAVSGRGVGMDVVRRQVEKMRGKIDIRSARGAGTTFDIKLPLTMAIIDGLVAGVGNERFVVPVFAVRELVRPTEEMLSTVHERDEMALVRGSLLPIVRLYRRFGVQPKTEDLCASVLIVAESRGRCFCLAVDELIGKQEVVIKSLGETLQGIRGVTGGAILGDGRVGLILDPETLFENAT